MELTRRLYHGEDDYWRIRAFLREVLLRNGLRELSWHVAEFDYWRWHLVANLGGWDLTTPRLDLLSMTWSSRG